MAGALVWLAAAAPAFAQQSTLSVLPEEPPEFVGYRLGPFLVNPNIAVPEFGHDSNVFNEQTAPKEDYVVKFTPDIDLFADFGTLRFAARSGTAFAYYHRYASERSIGQNVRGRLTARLSRIRPWVGGAAVVSNDRTDPEIDERYSRTDTEVAAGAGFEVSPIALLTVSAYRISTRVAQDEVFRETFLAPELDRDTETVAASLRLIATPFTTVSFNGYTSRDRFDVAAIRDSRSHGGEVEVSFSPEAIIRGKLALGFRGFEPEDPSLSPYRGISGRGGLTTILAGRAILGVDYARDVRYSYDRSEGYYVETGGTVVYTQRLGGPFDVQVRFTQQDLDYRETQLASERFEVLRSYQAGLGYSLENRSRFGVSYEFAERTGKTLSDRPFSRRRVFGSFTYEFWK